MKVLLHTFLSVLLINTRYECHPQCLDFRPPYKPTTSLNFCTEYTSYSCCSNEKDEALELDYKYALNSVTVDQSCQQILKDILCLDCHPYAAHIYDAETPLNVTVRFDKRNELFPGLCRDFCTKILDKCKPLLLKVARSDSFHNFLKNSTSAEFCDWAELSDKNYCYPDIDLLGKDTVTPESDDTVTLCVEPVAGDFANALVAVHSNDGTHRMFIGEQRGLIHVVDHTGIKFSTPFLDISEEIINSGSPWDERGLLGLVFHPRYRKNGRFFVYYSAPSDHNRSNYSTYDWYWQVTHKIRVSEYTVLPSNPNKADPDSELVLLEINQPEPNHNGGMLLFGTDGYLYLFPGDGGGRGDPHGKFGNSLNMSTLLGKTLRINVNSPHKLYSIPRDNPFIGISNAKPEIYAYGLRNAWRCSIDTGNERYPGTGRMFCGDVGQSRYEEIDIIVRGGNYGWRAREGFSCYDEKLCEEYLPKDLKYPIIVYDHSVGQSIVGGYVYRGCDNPNLRGKYFYADTMNGKIFTASEINGEWSTKQVIMGNSSICNNGLLGNYYKNILSFGESESGEIYILGAFIPNPNIQRSRMYRLVDRTLRGDPQECKYKVRKPKVLKKIKRRDIFYRLNKDKKEKKKQKKKEPQCNDTSLTCARYFKPYKGKKAFVKCESVKLYAQKYCKKTCNLCK